MKEICVSVIVPVYNTEKYLEQCLNSILGQTLQEIEVICVDDGSTDGSVDIIEKMCTRDARLHLLTQKNAGGGAARNRGMAEAKGRYLIFLDGDDYFSPELLESLSVQMERTQADVCICMARSYHEDLGFETAEPAAMRKEFLPALTEEKQTFCWRDMPDHIFNTFHNWPWNKMFRRSFVEEKGLKFQEIKRTNDLLFSCSALMEAERLTVVEKELVFYRVGISGSCQTTNREAPLDFYHAFAALKEFLEEKGLFEQVKRSFVNHALDGCIANLNSQENGPGQEELYRKLKGGLMQELGIGGQTEGYFHEPNKGMYRAYQVMMQGDYADYLRFRIQALKDERDQILVSEHQEKMRMLDQIQDLVKGVEGYRQQKHDLLASREYRYGEKLLYVPLKIKHLFD